ncbi:myotubularin-related protein 12-like [Arapaima gigas]
MSSSKEIKPEGEGHLQERSPEFLPGEVVFCSAKHILKCSQDEDSECSVFGTLFCTNFRVSFVSDAIPPEDTVQPFKNKLYGENDIPLSCVDQIYGDYDEKKKLITSSQMMNKYPSKIIIYCKDLRVFQFSLLHAKDETAKKIFQGIIRHILEPKSLKCVFAFSYGETTVSVPDVQRKQTTVMFDTAADWLDEMKRTKGGCKLVKDNEDFGISEKLPQFFFVPTHVENEDLVKYQGKGIPIWCWSHHTGCALFKMASLPVVQEESNAKVQKAYMERMLNAVAQNHLYSVKTEDLSETLPNIQDIQQSYSKFKQNFLIDSMAEFWVSDVKWFSTLETSRWLSIIRQCLHKAVEVVESLEQENTNIVLIEKGGSDLCCVISSLVQLMLDPYYRTLIGFQSLVQKEWVEGGHNFPERGNLLHQSDKESPVFLLFLECVWQLLQQHSPGFQFSETYLTVLSDSINVAVFSTFLFSTPCQKASIMKTEPDRGALNIPPVWEWSLQFDCKAQGFFINLLYRAKSKQEKALRKAQRPKYTRQLSLPSTPPPKKGFFKEETENLKKMLRGKRISRWMQLSDSAQASVREFYAAWQRKPLDYHGLLLPCLDGPAVRLWTQRYLRWIPEVQILGGGDVALMNKMATLVQEVQELCKEVDRQVCQADSCLENPMVFLRSSVHLSSSFPFAANRMWSFRPAIPTSIGDHQMDMGQLAIRDDEDTETTTDVF